MNKTDLPDPKDIICLKCANYIGGFSCLAFPDSIPDEIVKGDNDHSKPLREQENEIVFEPE